MSKWLYDPETDSRNGKEFTYNLPIHENEDLQGKISRLEEEICVCIVKEERM